LQQHAIVHRPSSQAAIIACSAQGLLRRSNATFCAGAASTL
jgi:hypothetical protein